MALGRSFFHTLFLTLSCLLVLFGASCNKGTVREPDEIEFHGAETRAIRLNETVSVQFDVFGEAKKTILGGTPEPPPAAGARIVFELTAPEGSGAKLIADKETGNKVSTITSAGGAAVVQLQIGQVPGVYKIKASIPDAPEVKEKEVIVLGGLVITGGNQDGWVGQKLDHPIVVGVQSGELNDEGKLKTDNNGEPLLSKDAFVQVHVKNVPKKTKIKQGGYTKDGASQFGVKLGKKQGKGVADVVVHDSPLGPEAARYPVEVKFFAVDRLNLIIRLLGGLAIFIFGMRMMSEGLSLTAGDKLRGMLNLLTKNRFAAATAGVVTTGLIQSSSACTVMVVGFVNAGLMRLEQAIGVIMGANIGTTVTAQMISFKLSHLALPAIAIGMVVLLFAKRSRTKFMAQILIGFGFLFFGMGQLAAPFKELKDAEMIINMFNQISCNPELGHLTVFNVIRAVGIGTLMTVVVQSSSASIGLLLALTTVGLIDPYTGFAILLGDNIGTTITAILASIGTSKTARQAACAHCLFNIIGTAVMIILVFVPWPGTKHPIFMEMVSQITDGDNFSGENAGRFLANCHTLFNVTCTLVFIGFVPLFAKACRFLIRGEEEQVDERKSFLEPHLIATPSIAIQQAWAELGYMLEGAQRAHSKSFNAIVTASESELDGVREDVKAQEEQLDILQHKITDYLSELSREPLTEEQGNLLPHILHSVNDAERIGDHSIVFLKLGKRVNKRNLPFSDQAKKDLSEMLMIYEELFSQCQSIISEIAKGEESHDPEIIKEHLDKAYATMKSLKKSEKTFYKGHIERQETGECDVRSGVIFLETIRTLLRSGDHVINIIEAASRIHPSE